MCNQEAQVVLSSTPAIFYYFNSSPEIICLTVMMYVRVFLFPRPGIPKYCNIFSRLPHSPNRGQGLPPILFSPPPPRLPSKGGYLRLGACSASFSLIVFRGCGFWALGAFITVPRSNRTIQPCFLRRAIGRPSLRAFAQRPDWR